MARPSNKAITSATKTEQLDSQERRRLVWKLRKDGETYRDIAAAIIAQYGAENLPKGYDERYASQDVHIELKKLRTLTLQDAETWRQAELEHLETAQRAIVDKVKSGSLPAIDRWIRISESRRKLLGLDAPQKLEMITWETQAIADIQAGVIDYYSLVEAFDEPTATKLYLAASKPIPSREGTEIIIETDT